jgi:tetratricopeptide (TPR) repeat protein
LGVIAWGALLALAPAAVAPVPAPAAPAPATMAPAPSDPLSRLCDLGITFALSGNLASADSAFVALLSRSPGDPRALNNLGNLRLWRGQPDAAMQFYRAAAAADTADAGIVLNGATALMLAGDAAGAREQAEAGVAQAGGVEPAAGLLGIPFDGEDDASRGADRAHMSREQALMLLRSAAHAVPADSSNRLPAAGDSSKAGGKQAPLWRSAGARGNQSSEAPPVVYWKR